MAEIQKLCQKTITASLLFVVPTLEITLEITFLKNRNVFSCGLFVS